MKLLGDEVAKDVENCGSGVSIAKKNYMYSGYNKFRPYRGRGAFRSGYTRGQRDNYSGRYHRYAACNYNQQQQYVYYRGGMPRMYGFFRGRRYSALATAAPKKKINSH